MKKWTLVLGALLVAAMSVQAVAQSPYRDQTTPSTRESITQPVMRSGVNGWFDASRFSMSHQMGMGYTSSGGQGVAQAYYLNTMSYRFSAPVLLKLRLGATNNPFAETTAMPGQSTVGSMLQNAQFFGGADLIWQPSENTRFQISFDQIPAGMYAGYGGYGLSPYGYMNRYPYGYASRRIYDWNNN